MRPIFRYVVAISLLTTGCGGGGPDLTQYGSPSELEFLSFPVLNLSEAIATLDATFRSDVQTTNASVASGARCHAILLDGVITEQVACGPVLRLESDLDAQWDRYSLFFSPVYEEIEPSSSKIPEQIAVIANPGPIIQRGTALGPMETLRGLDLAEVEFLDELPLPPPQAAGIIESVDLVAYGLVLPVPPADSPPLLPATSPRIPPPQGQSLVFPGGVLTLTGLGKTESLAEGSTLFRAAEGEEFRLASFDSTGSFTYTLDVDGALTPLAGPLPEGLPTSGLLVSAPKGAEVSLQVSDGVQTQTISLNDGSALDTPAPFTRATTDITWPIEMNLRETYPPTTMLDFNSVFANSRRYVEANLVVEGRAKTVWLTPHPRLVPPSFAYVDDIPQDAPFTWAPSGRAWLILPGIDPTVYDANRGNSLPQATDFTTQNLVMARDADGSESVGTFFGERNRGIWLFDVPEDFNSGEITWTRIITWVDRDGRNRGELSLDFPTFVLQ